MRERQDDSDNENDEEDDTSTKSTDDKGTINFFKEQEKALKAQQEARDDKHLLPLPIKKD